MTPKEQREYFLRRLAQGSTELEALKEAGYDPRVASAKLALSYAHSIEGRAEIERYRAEEPEKPVGERTAEDVLIDLRNTFKAAQRDGDHKAALKAIEMEGKQLGMFASKVEVTGKVDLVNTIIAARKRVSLARRDVEDAVVVEPKAIPAEFDFG